MKKRKDGRYIKKVTVNGKPRWIYGASQREIEHKMMQISAETEKGRPFDIVADEWWGEAYEEISTNTVAGYLTAMRRAVEWFGSRPVREITPRDVSAYFSSLARRGSSIKTIGNHKNVLSVIFKHAVYAGDLDYNPVPSAIMPKAREAEKRKAATPEEEATITAATEQNDKFPLPYLALYTGLRRGELLGLRREDLDFDKNTINVCRSIVTVGRPTPKLPKTDAGIRKVPMLANVREFLLRYEGLPEGLYLFTGTETPMTIKIYNRDMATYQKATGITCTLHQLRHSFTSIAVRAGVPVPTLQAILGHTHYSTTMDVYNEFRDDVTSTAKSIMDAYVDGPQKT